MTAAGWPLGPVGVGQTCLFCDRPVADKSECCPAFARAGVAAHRACCGCAAWAGWIRSGLPVPDSDAPSAEWPDLGSAV